MFRGPFRKTAAVFILFAVTAVTGERLSPQSVDDLDRQAQELYDQKDFRGAIDLWLRALDVDPENEKIQRKIEFVYEEKHRKDLAVQVSRRHLRMSKKILKAFDEEYLKDPKVEDYDQNRFDQGKDNAIKAINNFITAYRIDPNDSFVKMMRDEMERLSDDVKRIEEALKKTREERKKYRVYLAAAEDKMKKELYEEAIGYWDKILEFLPRDRTARTGKRNAELALQNRLKFLRIQKILALGVVYFKQKKYVDAQREFEQVLRIDPENDMAVSYLDEIREELDKEKSYRVRVFRAEQFYNAGRDYMRKREYEQAIESLESARALIDNYKDTAALIQRIEQLKKIFGQQRERDRRRKIENFFQSGITHYLAGNYKEALTSFEKVRELDPPNREVRDYIRRVTELLRQKSEETVDPESPYFSVINPLIVSGKILYGQGNYEESMERFDRVLKLFPHNLEAREFRFKCQYKMNPTMYRRIIDRLADESRAMVKGKNFIGAARNYRLIKAIEPGFPNIDQLISSARAAEETRQMRGATPAEIKSQYATAMGLYRKGGKENLTQAYQIFRWIIARDPANRQALTNANRIGAQLRIGRDATADLARKLTDKQQSQIRLHYFKGITYYSSNNFGRAVDEWRKVLAIDPYNAKAKNNIRKTLALMRR